MKVFILAAGLGTRLLPLTANKPKALVATTIEGKIQNPDSPSTTDAQDLYKPMLQWQMEKLYAAGWREAVINLHHFPSMIRDFILANKGFGLKVEFSDETDLLRDTGGAIRHAASLLADGDPVLVHNVDIFSDIHLQDFYKSGAEAMKQNPRLIAQVIATERKTSRYLLFDSYSKLRGWENIKTGEVKSPWMDGFATKDFAPKDYTPLAFGGIHLLSGKIFDLMASFPEKFSIIDFYLSLCRQWDISACNPNGVHIFDAGKL